MEFEAINPLDSLTTPVFRVRVEDAFLPNAFWESSWSVNRQMAKTQVVKYGHHLVCDNSSYRSERLKMLVNTFDSWAHVIASVKAGRHFEVLGQWGIAICIWAFGFIVCKLVNVFLHILGVIVFETPHSSVCVCYLQPLYLVWDWILLGCKVQVSWLSKQHLWC